MKLDVAGHAGAEQPDVWRGGFVTCSCGAVYAPEAFAALRLGAGHEGDPTPVHGVVVRLCAGCRSSVSVYA